MLYYVTGVLYNLQGLTVINRFGLFYNWKTVVDGWFRGIKHAQRADITSKLVSVVHIG